MSDASIGRSLSATAHETLNSSFNDTPSFKTGGFKKLWDMSCLINKASQPKAGSLLAEELRKAQNRGTKFLSVPEHNGEPLYALRSFIREAIYAERLAVGIKKIVVELVEDRPHLRLTIGTSRFSSYRTPLHSDLIHTDADPIVCEQSFAIILEKGGGKEMAVSIYGHSMFNFNPDAASGDKDALSRVKESIESQLLKTIIVVPGQSILRPVKEFLGEIVDMLRKHGRVFEGLDAETIGYFNASLNALFNERPVQLPEISVAGLSEGP